MPTVPVFTRPARVAVEERYQDVAIARLRHALLPGVLTGVRDGVFVDPDLEGRLPEESLCFDLLLDLAADIAQPDGRLRGEREGSLHLLEIMILIFEDVAIALARRSILSASFDILADATSYFNIARTISRVLLPASGIQCREIVMAPPSACGVLYLRTADRQSLWWPAAGSTGRGEWQL